MNTLSNTCRYRAKISKIFKDDYDSNAAAHVELDFVDYGDTEKQEVSEICNLKIVSDKINKETCHMDISHKLTLKQEFLSLSFQAIECAMADIEPA